MRSLLLLFMVGSLTAGCGGYDGKGVDADAEFPDVLDATAVQADDDTWTISATVNSPYDTPERYADAWRVLGPDDEVLGVRELAHDHATEQPFTRSLTDVEIDAAVEIVTIEGRDRANGWGGQTFELRLADAG